MSEDVSIICNSINHLIELNMKKSLLNGAIAGE